MNKTISREEQLFLAAVELDGPDKDAFLKQACGTNDSLRLRIKNLLEIHEQNDSDLEFTADGAYDRASANSNPEKDTQAVGVGSKIGDYKLLQEIGAGGMGVVYMAQQSAPVRRKVAIKIIKPGMDSKNVIARFEAERQALAIMEHPNITKVFDAGVCDAGRPYFVMELITGMSIVKYCDHQKLDLRQRMELFFKVCTAVHHAHQKGVIHRDIKPTNIMVTQLDGVAVPKIIDFGIAKAVDKPLTDKTMFTSYGNMVGTPEYMSPEQAEMNGLDVDTCSDVYSLGVVLYELMTGTTPFYRHRESGLRKFCDAICTEEPELASTRVNNLASTINEISINRRADQKGLKSFLRGDVDWILSKCLAKDRNNRYKSAAALAAEVQRYLDGDTVFAAAPSRTYRIKKFLARNRIAVSSAVLVASCLIVTSVVSFAFAARAIKAERLASQLLAQTQEAKLAAEMDRDRALVAQAELRKLERESRREAVQWQAGFQFMNMNNAEQTISELVDTNEKSQSLKRSAATPAAGSAKMQLARPANPTVWNVTNPKSDMHEASGAANQRTEFSESFTSPRHQRFKVAMEPDGNMCIAGMDDAFQIRFLNNSIKGNRETAPDCEIDVKTRCGKSREYALQALECLSSEMERRFGEKDVFVAGPKMKLAELHAQCNKWQNAEEQLRQVRKILKDNYGSKLMQTKSDILLALTLAKQNKFDEAKTIMANAKSNYKQEDFLQVLNSIRSNGEGLGEQLSEVTETMSEIFDSVEVKITDHLDSQMKEKLVKVAAEIGDVKRIVTDKINGR